MISIMPQSTAFHFKNRKERKDVDAYACNASLWEAEVGGSL